MITRRTHGTSTPHAALAFAALAACGTPAEDPSPPSWGEPVAVFPPAPTVAGCPGPCAWELDQTGDGRAERRAEFTYLPGGRPDRVRYLDADGRELRVRVYEYAADGRPVRVWTDLRNLAQYPATAGTDPRELVLSYEHDRPERDVLLELGLASTVSVSTPGGGQCEWSRVEHRRTTDDLLIATEECETGPGGAVVARRVRDGDGTIRAETRFDYACWPATAGCPPTAPLPGLATHELAVDEADMPADELEDLIAPFVGRTPRRPRVRWTPIDQGDGFRVTGLRPAPERGLRNGDVVLELAGRTLAERMAHPLDDVGVPVELVVRRGERTVLVRLRPR